MAVITRIIPLLVYEDIQAAHDFLVKAFGFTSGGVYNDERVRAYGARIDSEPQNTDYGQREYGVRDLEGHRWWFATPLAQSANV